MTPPPNPDAPIAFFGESNMSRQMRHEYAVALQNSGLYNFAIDNFAEEQVRNAVEIRLNYEEPGKKVLVLNAEIIKDGQTTFKTTIKEKYESKGTGQKVLLESFLQEVKRVSQ